jgi:hypothetical protein
MNGLILLLETAMYIPSDIIACAHADKEALELVKQAEATLLHPLATVETVKYNLTHHFAALSIQIAKAKKDHA